MTGLSVFVRMFARRDRWALLWWLLGGTAAYYLHGVQAKGQYPTQAALDQAAVSFEHNAAFIAMFAPARGLTLLLGPRRRLGLRRGANS